MKFTVQLEVKVEGKWREVSRYDCAHGYAHWDSYNFLGNHKKEDWHLRFEDALNLGDGDIDDNREIYRDRFFKRRFSMNVTEGKNTELIKEFNAYIREHPEFADRIPNNAIVIMQVREER